MPSSDLGHISSVLMSGPSSHLFGPNVQVLVTSLWFRKPDTRHISSNLMSGYSSHFFGSNVRIIITSFRFRYPDPRHILSVLMFGSLSNLFSFDVQNFVSSLWFQCLDPSHSFSIAMSVSSSNLFNSEVCILVRLILGFVPYGQFFLLPNFNWYQIHDYQINCSFVRPNHLFPSLIKSIWSFSLSLKPDVVTYSSLKMIF